MKISLVQKIAPVVLGCSLAFVPTSDISNNSYSSLYQRQEYQQSDSQHSRAFVSKRVRFLTNYEPPELC